MVPCRVLSVLSPAIDDGIRKIPTSSRRTPGPITPGVSSETKDGPQALCLNVGDPEYGSPRRPGVPALAGTTTFIVFAGFARAIHLLGKTLLKIDGCAGQARA